MLCGHCARHGAYRTLALVWALAQALALTHLARATEVGTAAQLVAPRGQAFILGRQHESTGGKGPNLVRWTPSLGTGKSIFTELCSSLGDVERRPKAMAPLGAS